MMKRKFKIIIDGKAYEVEVEEIEAEEVSPTVLKPSKVPAPQLASISRPTPPVSTPVQSEPKTAPVPTTEPSPREGIITAPISGTILRVNYKVGDSVNRGDVLLVLEAMKMENEIIASKAGIIKKIVSSNTTVDFGEVLCRIK